LETLCNYHAHHAHHAHLPQKTPKNDTKKRFVTPPLWLPFDAQTNAIMKTTNDAPTPPDGPDAHQGGVSARMVRDALRYLLDIGVVQYQPSKDVNNLQFTLTPKGEAYLHETHHSATGV